MKLSHRLDTLVNGYAKGPPQAMYKSPSPFVLMWFAGDGMRSLLPSHSRGVPEAGGHAAGLQTVAGPNGDFVDRWPPVLTLEQTARYLGIEYIETHLRGLIEKAGLPHLVLKPGGKTVIRVPRAELDEWIKERTKRCGVG